MSRVAAIHDLAGFSRTSLGVVIPLLSTLGVQVCPMPTAVLSTGTTGFTDFHFSDLTESMHKTLAHWQSLGLVFDAVYSGFLGSPEQVGVVAECIETCLAPCGMAVVDPVLGDDGKLEPTMGRDMVEQMQWLTSKATCITPNLTEAALLLDEPYPEKMLEKGLELSFVKDWLMRLAERGPEAALITNVPLLGSRHQSAVVAYEKPRKRFWKVAYDYIPAAYPGTGDIFTSVLTGCLLQKDSLPVAMDRAAHFVTLGIRATFGHNNLHREGILLERVLETLRTPVTALSYTLLE